VRKLTKSDKIGMIVAADINTAAIFNYYEIDFYSKGNRTLEESCIDGNVPIVPLLDDLSKTVVQEKRGRNFLRMSVKDLAHYILQNHHRYAENRLIFIKHALTNILKEYDDERQILNPVKKAFEDLSLQLTVQMSYEEFLIFPSLEKIGKKNRFNSITAGRTVVDHIEYMKGESSRQLEKLIMLRAVSEGYTAKGRDETLYEIAYSAMKELESDLKIHMHLENNILFPKVIASYRENQTSLMSDHLRETGIYKTTI
jgi:regulator of cell morphogenesis and NO signaling